MSRTTSLSLVALVTAASALASPAFATTWSESGQPTAQGRAGLKCEGGVVGFDSEHRVRADHLKNGVLVDSQRSAAALPFDVTAWGEFDYSSTRKRARFTLDTVSTDGKTRRVSFTTRTSDPVIKVGKITGYQQKGFTPRLFSDGYGFYAYTVDGGVLSRWILTRYRNGDVKFGQRVKLGHGFGDVTSLQSSTILKARGVVKEFLYATTQQGELLQIAVPVDHPNRTTTRKLATSGYDGVTELAWSFCNDDDTYHTLIAIDPTGNRATWSTIQHAITRPQTKLRGPVTGVADWHLSAAY